MEYHATENAHLRLFRYYQYLIILKLGHPVKI